MTVKKGSRALKSDIKSTCLIENHVCSLVDWSFVQMTICLVMISSETLQQVDRKVLRPIFGRNALKVFL